MPDRPITDPDLDAYATDHTSPEPEHLREVETSTRDFSPRYGMLVGKTVGRFLKMLVAVSGARRILEIGTFTGYSALSMAEALPDDGRVVTCELNEDHVERARANIEASPLHDRIEVMAGPALETIERLSGPFDLVFIDADKQGYVAYYEAVLPMLAPRGLIVVDNTLYHGRVLDLDDASAETQAIAAFNDHLVLDPRVEQVVLTVRDGVTLIRKVD